MPNKESLRRLSRHVFTASDERFIGGVSLLATVCLLISIANITRSHSGFVALDSVEPTPIRFEVDINQAPWTELAQLPRIGPVLASRIVIHRANNGPFRSVDDLQRVNGVGPKTVARITRALSGFVQQNERSS